MKIKRYYHNDITVNGVKLGITHKDSVILRRETDHNPKIQTFTFEDLEEPVEEQTYWCAICKSRLVNLERTDTIWRCDAIRKGALTAQKTGTREENEQERI
jgi:NAD-dependent DNA ligase